jgi:uncharacterized protein YbjT (DUF2867 family)
MKVVLFGATGMVGQGVLRACLLDAGVSDVLSIGRNTVADADTKLHQVMLADLTDYTGIEDQLEGFEACFFCLGVSSAGMSEQAYRHITYDITLAAASTLARLNPGMTFTYVSGAGTDSSEKGRVMWARVKGATENALLRLPFKAAYMFRPGLIQPLHGIRSRTPVYRLLYSVTRPALPVLLKLFPNSVTTTEQLGRAMLRVARDGYTTPILETRDICAL